MGEIPKTSDLADQIYWLNVTMQETNKKLEKIEQALVHIVGQLKVR